MASRVPRRVRPVQVAAVLGGSAALLGSWVTVVAEQELPPWEAELFGVVNGLPDGLWPLVWGPMQAGSLVGSLAAVGGTYAVTRDRRLALAALAGSQVAWWSGKGVKEVVARGRPGVFLPDARLREKATGLGYVSGHSAVAFSLVAVLAPALPRSWRPAAVGAASFVALARLYSGAHLPLDAVGGAGLGVLAGTMARWGLGLGGEGLPAR
jgi:glycosyltransferase 2 family protein